MTRKLVYCKFGTELELMLAGKKPMAMFYRATHERFDETGGQPFAKYVAAGQITRMHFFVSNSNSQGPYRIVYFLYTLPGEEWRAQVLKCLIKILQTTWNDELEALEGWLLGYEGYGGKPIA